MGLREKADFNLQAVTLFMALVAALFLCAARHYTSDWRERRVFRKHLDRTKSRLKHDDDAREKRSGRRQWKRFVAALPFMPLATAYVGVRIAWDLFELLVFWTIDVARHTATKTAQSMYSLAVLAYAQSTRLLVELDVKRRAQDVLIAVVENTVVWLFSTAFPAVGALGDRCAQQLSMFSWWWAERGGPWLRDAIELVVLEGIVPAYGLCSSALQSVYARSLWLASRCVHAATILATDLAHDVAIACAWIAAAVAWIAAYQRWCFDSRWMRFLAYYAFPSAELLESIRRLLLDSILPRCLLVIWQAYTHMLVPLACNLSRYGDLAMQTVLGAAIRVYKGLVLAKPALLELLELLSRVDFYAPAVRICVWFSEQIVSVLVRGPAQAWQLFCVWIRQSSWITAILWDAYARLSDDFLVPALQLLSRACMHLWQTIVCGSASMAAWRWLRVSAWPFISKALARCLYHLQRLLTVLSDSVKEALSTQGFLFRKWYGYSSEAAMVVFIWMHGAAGSVALWLQTNTIRATAAVWPFICRGFDDGVVAMRDVYRQLIVAMDGAVAVVGDLVVEFARSNTVHNTAESSASQAKG
ncbi:hypothetical protein EV175_003348 [Coemansia sp. RSA 1933]|nr:hypothetical protein EV175_003348 [Coemansia sp. RSA 1933]